MKKKIEESAKFKEQSEFKICTKCKSQFPATKDFFYIDRIRKDNLHPWCKKCSSESFHHWKQSNVEKIKANAKIYTRLHKKEKKIYDKNDPAKRMRNRIWRKKNPEKFRISRKQNQLRRRGLLKDSTKFNLRLWLKEQEPYRCYLCGKLIKKNEKFDIEHRVPISKGGTHSPWNLGIAHKKCNREKFTKTPWEFKPDRFLPGFLK